MRLRKAGNDTAQPDRRTLIRKNRTGRIQTAGHPVLLWTLALVGKLHFFQGFQFL